MNSALEQISGWLPVVYTFIPLLVGLLYKSSASEKVKSTLMIFVTGVATLAQQVIESNEVLTTATFITWVIGIITSVATYYGVWKPLGAGNIAPEVGVVG